MNSAIISDDGLYRYRLDRSGKYRTRGVAIAFIGINPSTADETTDDHTIRKMLGFAKVNHGSRIIVGNVFAYRATDVHELSKVEDPVGPLNALHLRQILREADIIVPCWGNRNKIPPVLHPHITRLMSDLRNNDEFAPKVRTFGLCKSGDPKHPLMLGYGVELKPW